METSKYEVRVEGRIEMHLMGGYTKVAIKLGGILTIDVKTDEIAPHLRGLGTRVLVISKPSETVHTMPSGDRAYGFDKTVVTDFAENIQLGWIPVAE